MNYTKEDIAKKFDTLPSSLKKFITEFNMSELIKKFQSKYNLHIDQVGVLALEINAVITGLVPSSQFNKNITTKLGISEDLANLITYDLNQEIFSQIRKELEKIAVPEEVRPEPKVEEDSSSSEKQIFQEKMSGISNVPKTEVAVEDKTEDNKDEATPNKPIRDPYREPIE